MVEVTGNDTTDDEALVDDMFEGENGEHDEDGENVYSYSRLSTFEQCPAKFAHRYVWRTDKCDEGHIAASVGKAAHGCAEDLVNEHVAAKRRDRLRTATIPDLLRARWVEENLPGDSEDFGLWLSNLRRWAEIEGDVDYRSVIGCELEFKIEIDGVKVRGVFDRVDRVDPLTVAIIDYKTNMSLFEQWVVDRSLQMSVYDLAARELWPEVEHVDLVYFMLRFGVRQKTSRSKHQREAARHYIRALVTTLESATEYPEKLNEFCAWCSYRHECDTYASSLKAVGEYVPPATLDDAMRERSAMLAVRKIANQRKSAAEAMIRAWIKRDGDVRAAGHMATFYNQTVVDYETGAVLEALAEATGFEHQEIADQICKIQKGKLDAFVASLRLDKGEEMVLTEELELLGESTTRPRLSIKEARTA